MKIIARFGYTIISFDADNNAGLLIEAIARGVPLKETYASPQNYYTKTGEAVTMEILQDDDIRLPDSENAMKPLVDKIATLSDELSKKNVEAYQLKQELDKIKTTINGGK
jgi:hypothetical protein